MIAAKQKISELAYGTRIGRSLVHRFGGGVWRLPAALRRRICHGGAAGVRKLAGARTWEYRTVENVRPPRLAAPPSFGHRVASRPYRLAPAMVSELPGAWLVGKHAAAVTDHGRLLMGPFRDSAKILGLEANEDLVGWLARRGWEEKSRGGEQEPWTDVCSLVSRLDPNYFHWIIESCGQAEGLKHYEKVTGVVPKVVIRGGGARYIRPSLELLGVAPERIIEWEPEHEPQLVERLVVPSRPGSQVACSPASLRWLRQRFLSAAGVDMNSTLAEKRLYIPRKQGGWRCVENEEVVIPRLISEGFEVVRAETLTFVEQIRLFSQANLIVGLFGAGLANILFAPKASLLELSGAYGDGTWFSTATGLGQPWRALCCEPRGENVIVDVDAVLREADRMTSRKLAAAVS